MRLLDVNILVQAHREDAGHHEAITGWLTVALGEAPGLAVSELVLSGVVRVVTHPRVFREPTPAGRAIEFVEDFRARRRVRVLAPGPDHWEIFVRLCRDGQARGNLVADAYHAALAIEHGCEWVTLDRGFARFPGLRWSSPLDPGR